MNDNARHYFSVEKAAKAFRSLEKEIFCRRSCGSTKCGSRCDVPSGQPSTVIAVFAAHFISDGHVEVLSVGSGCRSVGHAKVLQETIAAVKGSQDGGNDNDGSHGDLATKQSIQQVLNALVLYDGHAEVMARRALIASVLSEMKFLLMGNGSSSSGHSMKGQGRPIVRLASAGNAGGRFFEQHPDAEIHLLVSQMPCGDCSIYGGKGTGAHVLLPPDGGLHVPCSQAAADDAAECPYRTDAGRIASHFGDEAEGGCTQRVTGHRRTKPGKGIATLSMSCTDKLRRWGAFGLGGSALSRLFLLPAGEVKGGPVQIPQGLALAGVHLCLPFDELSDDEASNDNIRTHLINAMRDALERNFKEYNIQCSVNDCTLFPTFSGDIASPRQYIYYPALSSSLSFAWGRTLALDPNANGRKPCGGAPKRPRDNKDGLPGSSDGSSTSAISVVINTKFGIPNGVPLTVFNKLLRHALRRQLHPSQAKQPSSSSNLFRCSAFVSKATKSVLVHPISRLALTKSIGELIALLAAPPTKAVPSIREGNMDNERDNTIRSRPDGGASHSDDVMSYQSLKAPYRRSWLQARGNWLLKGDERDFFL